MIKWPFSPTASGHDIDPATGKKLPISSRYIHFDDDPARSQARPKGQRIMRATRSLRSV
jgi:hypothetical protein